MAETNNNLVGTENMGREELLEVRNRLQSEIDEMDFAVEMFHAKRDSEERPLLKERLWLANLSKSKTLKVRARDRLNAELGELRRREAVARQQQLDVQFMKVARERLPDEEFYAILRAAQAATDFRDWEVGK